MTVIKIERYRAKCHACGGIGELRDDETSAVARVVEQGWRYVLVEDGGERLLCGICFREREKLEEHLKVQLQATAARAMAAKAAAWDRLSNEAGAIYPTPLSFGSGGMEDILRQERARRGLP